MDWAGVTGSIFGALGDACAYRTIGGVASTVQAVVRDGVEVVDESGQIIERIRAATMDKADLSDTPKMGDTLTVGSRVYVVQRLLSDDGYAVQVSLS